MQKDFGVEYTVIDVPLNQENEKIADKEAYLKSCDKLYEREGIKANWECCPLLISFFVEKFWRELRHSQGKYTDLAKSKTRTRIPRVLNGSTAEPTA